MAGDSQNEEKILRFHRISKYISRTSSREVSTGVLEGLEGVAPVEVVGQIDCQCTYFQKWRKTEGGAQRM